MKQVAGSAVIRVFEADEPAAAHGYWLRAWQRLRRNRLAVVSLIVIGLLVLVALLAPLVAPSDPMRQDLMNTFASPSLQHPAGTDNLGRDWFSRLVYGARVSLSVGLLAQAVVVGIGLPLGLSAGFHSRFADGLIMRFTDLVYAFPDLLLIILLRAVLGGNIFTLFLIIGVVSWVDITRLVRGQVLSLKEREFVTAARSLGASDREIMTRHLLPNLVGPLIVLVAFGVPRAVFIEAALSFIGFGVSPGTPSWGSMVQEGYSAIFAFPHLVILPSAAIAVLMLAFTFLGDGLRDALDPTTEASTKPVDASVSRRSSSRRTIEEREQPQAA
jgi:oligopeptide transport system permease protein